MAPSSNLSNDSDLSDSSSSESAVQKVCNVVELLELILDETNLCGLFRVAAVSRKWKNTFEDSKKLQKKAHLIDDTNGFNGWYEDDFDEEFGLIATCNDAWLAEDGKLDFQLFFSFETPDHPIKVTKNLSRCFATQLPCKELQVIIPCCREDTEYIRRSTGLTIGDVVDTALRITAEHANCPEMIAKAKATHGMIETQKREKMIAAERVKQHEDEGWANIWYAFRKVRRDAAAHGNSPPRWPEFLTENKHLAPTTYELNSSEASAVVMERHLTIIEDSDEEDEDFDDEDDEDLDFDEDEEGDVDDNGEIEVELELDENPLPSEVEKEEADDLD